jgi:radical SAM family uncharacterized protein
LADFVDLFLIGDGEEAITEILDIYKSFKLSRVFDTNAGRELLLGQMSKIEGVYVPSLYKPTYSGNSLSAITPRSDETSSRVKKRTIKKLGLDHFPTEPIVPFISTIHDRITLEIMKGCMHSCRFCQARNIYSPVRIREVDELLKLADQTFKKTGFDEISLVSLSSWSYPYIEELIKELSNIFTSRGVNISLPSLRIDENIDRLPSLINTVRKSGLTFAPEVGSERMLKVINKNIDYERFFKAIKVAYEKGWSRVKLYFMIGLPFEEAADIEAIIELADKVALLRKEVSGYPAEVVINVSSFIPKPHTSFQWFGMASFDELREKQDLLIKKSARKRYLKLKMHDIDASILEAVFSRGDRRLASVLLEAWGNGCRFDAWSESLNMKGWEEAFSKSGIDKGYYLRRLGLDEVLAWEHIFCGIEKECLLLDYRKACE